MYSSAATATTAGKLVDSGRTFVTDALVSIDDWIVNNTDGTTARVTAIDSETQLSISSDIMASGEDYTIFASVEGSKECCELFGYKWDGAD